MYLRTLYLCYVEFRIEIMAIGETRKKEKALSTARSFGKGKTYLYHIILDNSVFAVFDLKHI